MDFQGGNFLKEQDADSPLWLIDFNYVNLLPPSFFFWALCMPPVPNLYPGRSFIGALQKLITADDDTQRNLRLMTAIYGYWVVHGANTSIGKLRV